LTKPSSRYGEKINAALNHVALNSGRCRFFCGALPLRTCCLGLISEPRALVGVHINVSSFLTSGSGLVHLLRFFARPASRQQRPQFSHVSINTLQQGACIPAGLWIGGFRHVDRSGFCDHGFAQRLGAFGGLRRQIRDFANDIGYSIETRRLCDAATQMDPR
jgi:hypothetical protein